VQKPFTAEQLAEKVIAALDDASSHPVRQPDRAAAPTSA
jgi:hypothetical protein